MSFQTYKILKTVAQILVGGAGVYAMYLGADPMTAFALIVLTISGPETFEYILSQQDS